MTFRALWFRPGNCVRPDKFEVAYTCDKGPSVPTEPSSASHAKARRPEAVSSGPETRQRQRAMRVDVKISRQAMKVVLPTNQQIGPWQARAAHLLVIAEKLTANGRYDHKIADEAQTLLEAVETHQQELSETLENLPADVAGSTRLDDTARALQSVASVLERTLALIAPSAEASMKAGSRPRPADRVG